MGWLKKLRHTHGFGVHSPFAFHLITKVMGDKQSAYYLYDEIDEACQRAPHTMSSRSARKLLRLLCYFHPQQVRDIGEGDSLMKLIVPPTLNRTEEAGEFREVTIINKITDAQLTAIQTDMLKMANEGKTHVMLLTDLRGCPNQRHLYDQMAAKMTCGMTFNDGHIGVVVARSDLPVQSFDLFS